MVAMHTVRAFCAGAIAVLAAACVPASELPDTRPTEALLREAAEAGGREDPGAAYYLSLADRELSRARMLVEVRDAEGAWSWARRAAADADVARLLAYEASVRAAALRTEADADAIERRIEERR
jgi:hypothetical protein